MIGAVEVPWSTHETAIVVYFASRCVHAEGCTNILALKTGGTLRMPRTAQDVEGRLEDIRRIPGLWDRQLGWNRPVVDEWLVGIQKGNLRALVGVGFEELQMVLPVSLASI